MDYRKDRQLMQACLSDGEHEMGKKKDRTHNNNEFIGRGQGARASKNIPGGSEKN